MLYNTMKQYSVAYTRLNLKSLLETLPFEITRYGRVIAKVQGYTVDNVVQDTSATKPLNPMGITPKTATEAWLLKQNNRCKHGSLKGLCKYGCK